MELGPLLRVVKNLRGVLYACEPQASAAQLAWVRKKFQYRTVGYTPATEAAFRDAGTAEQLATKPFCRLEAPTPAVNSLVRLCRHAAADPQLAEALLLASLHVAPMLLLGSQSAGAAAPFSLHTLDASPQSDAEAKRHLRILDYAALDAHGEASARSLAALSKAARQLAAGNPTAARRTVSQAITQQRHAAQQDCTTRFWRLIQTRDENARPTVFYLSPVVLARQLLNDPQKALRLGRLILRARPQIEPCFSVVPSMVVTAGED